MKTTNKDLLLWNERTNPHSFTTSITKSIKFGDIDEK